MTPEQAYRADSNSPRPAKAAGGRQGFSSPAQGLPSRIWVSNHHIRVMWGLGAALTEPQRLKRGQWGPSAVRPSLFFPLPLLRLFDFCWFLRTSSLVPRLPVHFRSSSTPQHTSSPRHSSTKAPCAEVSHVGFYFLPGGPQISIESETLCSPEKLILGAKIR